jgi:hypothetical protein
VSYWEIAVMVYLILTPWSEILTIALIMVSVQEWQYRKKRRGD